MGERIVGPPGRPTLYIGRTMRGRMLHAAILRKESADLIAPGTMLSECGGWMLCWRAADLPIKGGILCPECFTCRYFVEWEREGGERVI